MEDSSHLNVREGTLSLNRCQNTLWVLDVRQASLVGLVAMRKLSESDYVVETLELLHFLSSAFSLL
jgi:hypothetical protein